MLLFALPILFFICAFGLIESDQGIPDECLPFVYAEYRSEQAGSLGFYKGAYDYGFVEVREGAHMFYWLYYAAGIKANAHQKPLIIWIQGGPGIPASGVGNFEEIGPQDIYHRNRTSSWVHKRNVLFIDSPVGTGFSYVTDPSLLVKTDHQLANDLVTLMKNFLTRFPGFQTVPTHIFSQSYGAKIAPRFAHYLHKEVKQNRLKMNLKSVVMGSAYVSPRDSIIAYPDYLYNMGLINSTQFDEVHNYTREMIQATGEGQDEKALNKSKELFNSTADLRKLVNIYNLFSVDNLSRKLYYERWYEFMNETVRKHLLKVVPEKFESYSDFKEKTWEAMVTDLYKSSTDMVEKLLEETNMTVVVHNGMLDATSPIAGALEWVHRLKWAGSEKFKNAEKFILPGGNGLIKSYGRLSFWWIYNAGLSVAGNPAAMELILNVTADWGDIMGGDPHMYYASPELENAIKEVTLRSKIEPKRLIKTYKNYKETCVLENFGINVKCF